MFNTRRVAVKEVPNGKVEEAKVKARKSKVPSRDLRITLENVTHYISGYGGDVVDRDSVVKFINSLYEWMSNDPNMQLDLPVEPGSAASAKMWPQGAVIDSRRRSSAGFSDKNFKRLGDLDEETALNVASSVVSSTRDDSYYDKPRGKVYVESPQPSTGAGGHYYNTDFAPLFDRSARLPMRANVAETMRAGGPGQGHMPRYSLSNVMHPPVRTAETPEIHSAALASPRKSRKPKVGSAPRGEGEDGTPVVFAD